MNVPGTRYTSAGGFDEQALQEVLQLERQARDTVRDAERQAREIVAQARREADDLLVVSRERAERQALEQLGEGRSIRALEMKFATVRYFACSALGRMPDHRDQSPFQGTGVTEPFLWLLGLDRVKRRR